VHDGFAYHYRSSETTLQSIFPISDKESSLSYELGATNILEMLTLAGIPLTWREREEGNYPLIFAGDKRRHPIPNPMRISLTLSPWGMGKNYYSKLGWWLKMAKMRS
jgi:Radical SAM proteins, N-terminal